MKKLILGLTAFVCLLGGVHAANPTNLPTAVTSIGLDTNNRVVLNRPTNAVDWANSQFINVQSVSATTFYGDASHMTGIVTGVSSNAVHANVADTAGLAANVAAGVVLTNASRADGATLNGLARTNEPGKVSFTNANNVIAGNGGALTGLNANQVTTGRLSAAVLPFAAVTNNAPAVNLGDGTGSSTFTGVIQAYDPVNQVAAFDFSDDHEIFDAGGSVSADFNGRQLINTWNVTGDLTINGNLTAANIPYTNLLYSPSLDKWFMISSQTGFHDVFSISNANYKNDMVTFQLEDTSDQSWNGRVTSWGEPKTNWVGDFVPAFRYNGASHSLTGRPGGENRSVAAIGGYYGINGTNGGGLELLVLQDAGVTNDSWLFASPIRMDGRGGVSLGHNRQADHTRLRYAPAFVEIRDGTPNKLQMIFNPSPAYVGTMTNGGLTYDGTNLLFITGNHLQPIFSGYDGGRLTNLIHDVAIAGANVTITSATNPATGQITNIISATGGGGGGGTNTLDGSGLTNTVHQFVLNVAGNTTLSAAQLASTTTSNLLVRVNTGNGSNVVVTVTNQLVAYPAVYYIENAPTVAAAANQVILTNPPGNLFIVPLTNNTYGYTNSLAIGAYAGHMVRVMVLNSTNSVVVSVVRTRQQVNDDAAVYVGITNKTTDRLTVGQLSTADFGIDPSGIAFGNGGNLHNLYGGNLQAGTVDLDRFDSSTILYLANASNLSAGAVPTAQLGNVSNLVFNAGSPVSSKYLGVDGSGHVVLGTPVGGGGSGSGNAVTNNSAPQTWSGQQNFTNSANVFAGSGSNLTALNASQLTSGSMPLAAIPTNLFNFYNVSIFTDSRGAATWQSGTNGWASILTNVFGYRVISDYSSPGSASGYIYGTLLATRTNPPSKTAVPDFAFMMAGKNDIIDPNYTTGQSNLAVANMKFNFDIAVRVALSQGSFPVLFTETYSPTNVPNHQFSEPARSIFNAYVLSLSNQFIVVDSDKVAPPSTWTTSPGIFNSNVSPDGVHPSGQLNTNLMAEADKQITAFLKSHPFSFVGMFGQVQAETLGPNVRTNQIIFSGDGGHAKRFQSTHTQFGANFDDSGINGLVSDRWAFFDFPDTNGDYTYSAIQWRNNASSAQLFLGQGGGKSPTAIEFDTAPSLNANGARALLLDGNRTATFGGNVTMPSNLTANVEIPLHFNQKITTSGGEYFAVTNYDDSNGGLLRHVSVDAIGMQIDEPLKMYTFLNQSTKRTIDTGQIVGTAIYWYNGNDTDGQRTGVGISSSELQHFNQDGVHFSVVGGGKLQATGTALNFDVDVGTGNVRATNYYTFDSNGTFTGRHVGDMSGGTNVTGTNVVGMLSKNVTIQSLNALEVAGITNVTDGVSGISYRSNMLTGAYSSISTNANKVTTGTEQASAFYGSGANLTTLNASQLTSGTVTDARLSTNVVLAVTNGATPGQVPVFTGTGYTLQTVSGSGGTVNATNITGLSSNGLVLVNTNFNLLTVGSNYFGTTIDIVAQAILIGTNSTGRTQLALESPGNGTNFAGNPMTIAAGLSATVTNMVTLTIPPGGTWIFRDVSTVGTASVDKAQIKYVNQLAATGPSTIATNQIKTISALSGTLTNYNISLANNGLYLITMTNTVCITAFTPLVPVGEASIVFSNSCATPTNIYINAASPAYYLMGQRTATNAAPAPAGGVSWLHVAWGPFGTFYFN